MGALQSLWTVIVLVIFLGIVYWAWSGKRKAHFDAAAKIPLEDDDPTPRSGSSKESRHG